MLALESHRRLLARRLHGRPLPTGESRKDSRQRAQVSFTMHMIVFSTLVGAPLAMLGLSSPETPQRSCVFVVHPQLTSATLNSREGQVVLPDRPTEYPCSYQTGKTGTVIAFTNQN